MNKFFKFGISLKELLLLVITGGLVVYSMPVYSFSFCIFFSFVPLFLVLKNKSVIVSFRIGLITGFITYSILLSWLYLIFGSISIIFFVVLSLFSGLFCLCFSLVRISMGYWLALIFSPLLWVSIEYLKSEQWALRFGWMSLGYSVHNIEIFMGLAKYIGIYGISFVLILINILLVFIISGKKILIKSISLFLIITIFLTAYILNKNKNPETSSRNVYCRLVQTENDFKKCLELSVSKPIPEDSIIVFPEYSIWDSPIQNQLLKREIDGFIDKTKSNYIIGCLYFEKNKKNFFNNIALLISNKKEFIGKYQKHHPIPFFIDGEAGTDYPVFKIGGATAGVGVCFDYDFEDVSRKTVQKGAEILFNPTYDAQNWWYIQHIQHSFLLPFRAVETGRYALRAASSGISLVISPNGKILKQTDYTGEYILDFKIPLLTTKTFYVKYGYILPFLIQSLTVIIVIISVFKILYSKFFRD